jgi:hypothetical protein
MRANRLIALASSAWRAGRCVCGLALVTAACSGVAQATPPSLNSAPEIDPGSIKAALMLLGGGVLLVTDRFRRRSR